MQAILHQPRVHEADIVVVGTRPNTWDHVAVHLKARPYVFDGKYEKAFETDVHLRVVEAFREHSVAPPAILHRSLVR